MLPPGMLIMGFNAHFSALLITSLMMGSAAQAQQAPPQTLLPQMNTPTPAPSAPTEEAVSPAPTPAPFWSLADAKQLLSVIEGIGKRGLLTRDYEPQALRAALATGEGEALNTLASKLFSALAADLRDGRTPIAARGDWFVDDPDAQAMPTDIALQIALESHDVDAALTRLEPKHPDYAALKAELARTPATSTSRIGQLRINLDRWRWLPQSLGDKHILANVPEYMVRINTYGRNIAAYRVIVGKRDTPTPQLSTTATGIVVHPPWVLPQSIIRQEVGPLIARDPALARARGYVWTGTGKTLSVVQKPGPTAALGQLKLDMPNDHAIFFHDTPNKTLFANNPRAYSHGCLRTDRAFEFGILLSLLQSGEKLNDAAARNRIADNLVQLIRAGDTAKSAFKSSIPVHIAYFTVATAGGTALQTFPDLYGRDASVLAALAAPRQATPPSELVATPAVTPKG